MEMRLETLSPLICSQWFQNFVSQEAFGRGLSRLRKDVGNRDGVGARVEGATRGESDVMPTRVRGGFCGGVIHKDTLGYKRRALDRSLFIMASTRTSRWQIKIEKPASRAFKNRLKPTVLTLKEVTKSRLR